MLQPAPAVGAPLICEALSQTPFLFGRNNERPALPRRDLLVRIERKDRWVAVRAEGLPTVASAECFAGILDEREFVASGDISKLIELHWVAKNVDRENGPRTRRNRAFDRRGIEIERVRIYVDKDRFCTFVEHAVRRSHEGEWRGDDLVSCGDLGHANCKMQTRRSTRDSDRMGRVDCVRDKMLKAFDHWAEGESSRCKNISDKLALALADRRESEWDGITHGQSIPLDATPSARNGRTSWALR